MSRYGVKKAYFHNHGVSKKSNPLIQTRPWTNPYQQQNDQLLGKPAYIANPPTTEEWKKDNILQRVIETRQAQLEQQAIQTKLTVGEPGDKYEQEADAMASQVMSMPDTAVQKETKETEEQVQTKPLPESLARLAKISVSPPGERLQPRPLSNFGSSANHSFYSNFPSNAYHQRNNQPAQKPENTVQPPTTNVQKETEEQIQTKPVAKGINSLAEMGVSPPGERLQRRPLTNFGASPQHQPFYRPAWTRPNPLRSTQAPQQPENTAKSANMFEPVIQRQIALQERTEEKIQTQPAPDLQQRGNDLIRELEELIRGADWEEIRKLVYPRESRAGIEEARERRAGRRPDLTGLGQLTTLESFANRVHGIQSRWASLSEEQRAGALLEAANIELENVNVPGFLEFGIVTDNSRGSFIAYFWKFNINKTSISGSSLSNDVAADITNTTLHEARHAEQTFIAARYAAGIENKTAAQISRELQIPRSIAEKAVERKFDAKTDPRVTELARDMNQAYVTNGASNQHISDNLGQAIGNLKEQRQNAVDTLTRLRSNITEETLREATGSRDTLRAQISLIENLYSQYRNIPYERDAHNVGDAAELAFRGWPER